MSVDTLADPAALRTPIAKDKTPAANGHEAAESPDGLRPVVSLNGEWTFQFGDESPQSIQVPCPWEAERPDLHNRAGTAIYERTFTVPKSFESRRVVLCFESVDYFAEVWVNGILVGMHEGGYTPFQFPIEQALHGYGPDAVHTVLVRVTDSTVDQDAVLPNGRTLLFAEIPHGKQSWYTSVGGIWRDVRIEARSQISIARAAFYPNVEAGSATVRLALEGVPQTLEPGWQVRLCLDAPTGAGRVTSVTLPVDPAARRLGDLLCLETQIDVPGALLWSPETPYLYHTLTTVECDGEVVDAISDRFGMRRIEARDGRVWLNGKPIVLMGALDQAFYPRTIYTAPSEGYLRDQFLKAKTMGLNLMRCHIMVPDTAYLRLCDELGLLVWYEIPNGARLSEEFRARARQTLEDMWWRDANHPSTAIVSLINESWGIDLNDGEQRRWLAATYRWAKELAPQWLVVDNSACIPNFHVVSDLDDYHVYFNIPDQAEDFTEWIHAFAGREAGTFTGYGDAEYRRNEPLLISEFGNWGLPHIDNILAAEGGEPYWFKTGDGAVRPARVLERFTAQRLDRVFKDYNTLADASQEQEWLSLKWEIEEMRLHPQVAGYVITEFTDINWECNGLLDMARNEKVFFHRLADIQQPDIIIPRLSPRAAFWEGESAALSVHFSCFSGRPVVGGTLSWSVDACRELSGEEPVRLVGQLESEPAFGSYQIAQVWITAPHVAQPEKTTIRLTLKDAKGEVVARNAQNIVFVPAARRTVGKGKTVWLYDPFGSAIGLSSLLTGMGFRIVTQPEPGAIGLVTRWDPTVSGFLHGGGTAILVATHTKSITIASGLGVRLLERNTNGWWGDWCTSKIWFVPELFPSIPDTVRFDFEFQPIVPERVITGPVAENIAAGLFVGWLHNPASIVARLPIGKGNLVATTFELLPHVGSDPIATLVFSDLIAMPPAVRLD